MVHWLKTSRTWIAGALMGVVLTGAAVGLAQKTPDLNGPVVAHNENNLSSVFRDVSKEVLPSIVSIETRGKSTQMTNGVDLGDEMPFKEFFGNDPRFKEFFKNRPQGQGERRVPGSRGMGSGFIIDASGIVMTNAHVVRDAEEVTVQLQDGRQFIASDIKFDSRTDVAVLKIEGAGNLKPLPIGDSDLMQIGDWVLAVGSPFGLDLSVTHGIISAKGRGPGITEREDFLQTDAPINPGNSGGPLVNLNGQAIGINTAISTRSGGSQGVGFTIPINMAKWVADQLLKNGEVRRAYLGVSLQPVDHRLAKQFHAEAGHGALVNQVVPNSPAAGANLQSGDVVVELNGKKVDSPKTLQGLVEQLTVGKSYPMVVLRDGKQVTLNVEAKEMPKNYSRERFDEGSTDDEAPAPGKTEELKADPLGVKVKDLTPELAKEYSIPDAKGVVVTDVASDSAAEQVQLRPGDVILEVNRQKTPTAEAYAAAMKQASVKDGVLLLVRTGRVTRYLSVQSR